MYDKITKDMTQAMKDQNKFDLSVLRMLKSALQLEKINKKSDLSDDDVIAVIKKQVKMRTDSITEFQKFNRTEEIANLEKEIALLKTYLPEELSEDEINEKIAEAFNKVNPTSMKDMGMVMKELQSISSRADMSVVSSKVKEKIMEL
jgi:hypothetical protein